MTSIRTGLNPGRVLVTALALGAAVGLATATHASTRNYLTVEGRVVDHLGNPLGDTWVYCLGSRRASVEADSLGRYRLEIPGATLEELEHTPLKIRVQARRSGYRFALANGAPELGLEMRVVKDDSPLARLRVRSNDSTTVSAVANSVVLDANPRALLSAQFVGSRGAQYDTPPVSLDESDEITLAGDSKSIPEAPPPILPPPAVSAPASVSTTPPAAPQSAPKSMPTGTGEPAPGKTTTSTAPAPPGVPPATAQSPPAKAQPPATSSKSSSSEPKKWNAAGSDKDGAKPHTVRPGNPTPSTTTAHAGTSAPPAGSSAPPAATHPEGSVAQGTPDPNLKPVYLRDVPAEKVAPGSPKPAQSVPVAPGTSLPTNPSGTPSVPMCDCTIRGTVEVQWDRPLTSRTEVVISIEDAPDVVATAELFMGSPRAFEIHPAPCGVHRLRLWTRSKQRFVLVSSEPRVVCSPGGVQQMRLVLEPVARWGASSQ